MIQEVFRSTLRLTAVCATLLLSIGTFAAGYYVGYFQAWREAVSRDALTPTLPFRTDQ